MIVIGVGTIPVDDDVRDALLRISAELQSRLGRRVSYSDVIRYLMGTRVRRPELLDAAVIKVVRPETLIRELQEERSRDEERLGKLLRAARGEHP